jgi:hypothetical protein
MNLGTSINVLTFSLKIALQAMTCCKMIKYSLTTTSMCFVGSTVTHYKQTLTH